MAHEIVIPPSAGKTTPGYFVSMAPDPSSGVMGVLFLRVLREAFEGQPGPWSCFTGKDSRAGVFGTLEGLSAADASRRIGASATTIVDQVHHLAGSYDTILMTIQSQGRWDEDAFGRAVGAIAHVAYHLEAIRQRLTITRALATAAE